MKTNIAVLLGIEIIKYNLAEASNSEPFRHLNLNRRIRNGSPQRYHNGLSMSRNRTHCRFVWNRARLTLVSQCGNYQSRHFPIGWLSRTMMQLRRLDPRSGTGIAERERDTRTNPSIV